MLAKKHAVICADICEMCGNHGLMQPDGQSKECGRICLECAKECVDFAGMNMPYGRAWAPGYGFFGRK
jgi:hypothetical protein